MLLALVGLDDQPCGRQLCNVSGNVSLADGWGWSESAAQDLHVAAPNRMPKTEGESLVVIGRLGA